MLHPIVVVRRAPDGKLADVLTRADPDAPPPDALAESWTRLELAPLAVSADKLEAKLTGVLRDVREIVADAQPMRDRALRDRRHARRPTRRPRRHPPGRRRVAAALARRRAPHVPRLPPPRRRARRRPAARQRVRARHAARRHPRRRHRRRARRARRPPRTAGDHPGQRPQPAQARAPLLPRRADLRRRGPPHRRAPLPRHPHRARAVRERAGHPGGGAPGARRHPPRRVPARVLLRPADAGSDLRPAPRGAVQRHGGAAARDRGRRARRGRPARGAPLPAPRPVPPLHLLPGLPPARPVHDLVPARDGRPPAAPPRRQLGGVHRRGSRSRGWRWCTSRCRRTADAVGYAGVDVAGLQDELTEVVRTWDDRLLSEPGGRRSPPSSRACRRRTRPSRRPRGRWRTSAGSPRWRARSTSRCACARPKAPPTAASPSTSRAPRPRSPTCCRCCSSSGSTSSTSVPRSSCAPTACACTSTTSASGSTTPPAPRSTRGPRRDIEREFCAAFGAAWRGDVETDRFSALVLRAGLPWREVGGAARLRPLRPPDRRAVRPRLHGGHAARAPRRRARAAGALPGPVRPGAASIATRRSRTPSPTCAPGSTPSPGWTPTASCAASSR